MRQHGKYRHRALVGRRDVAHVRTHTNVTEPTTESRGCCTIESTVSDSDESVALLTVVEAARMLRISRNLAYELIAQHQIPCIRLGRVIRVPRGALLDWVKTESRAGKGPAMLG